MKRLGNRWIVVFVAAAFGVALSSHAEEPGASASGVVEQPEPLPPMAKEYWRQPHGRTVAKKRARLRSPRAQRTPVVMSQAKLNTSPYYFVGYVSFLEGSSPYQGSGNVVRPRTVLTCAHVLWTPGIGWSTNIKFYRARYGSGTYKSVSAPSRIYIHGNYQSNANSYGQGSYYTFAWDIGWMTFSSSVANGGYSGRAINYGALTGTNYCIAVGYGGGTYPKYCEPSRGYSRWNGTAYFTNSSYDHQGGMSGGPVFAKINGSLYETAVVVSSGGGVRALDSYVYNQLSSLP